MKRRYYWAVVKHGHFMVAPEEKGTYGYGTEVNPWDGYESEEAAIAGYKEYLESNTYSEYKSGLFLISEYIPE